MPIEKVSKQDKREIEAEKNDAAGKAPAWVVYTVIVGVPLTPVAMYEGKNGEAQAKKFVSDNRLHPVINRGANYTILPLA